MFSERELARRQQRFARQLGELDLHAAFVHTADNAYYLTGVPLLSGWGRPLSVAVAATGETLAVAAMLERENVAGNGLCDRVVLYDDAGPTATASLDPVVAFLGERRSGELRIGVEATHLPLATLEYLRRGLPGATFADVSGLLEDARIVKSDEEAELLEFGGEVAKDGASTFAERLRPGVSELEVASASLTAMHARIAADFPDGATSSYVYRHFADHTLTPHLHPTGRTLRRGDVVGLNVFPVIWGYCMELERTLVVGVIGDAQRAALDAVNEAHEAAKALVEPGRRLSEVDRTATGLLERRGHGHRLRHGTGHAHGIMIGAASREARGELRPYNDTTFAPGMFTSIEPGVYDPGLGGFRHSDVLRVTEAGARCLTDVDIPQVLPTP